MDQLTFLETEVAEPDELIARKAEASARLGVAPDHIRGVQFELDILRRQGILVDLNISGVGMFTRQATWMELGIPEEDARRARLTRGQKFLIPEEQVKRLRSVESQMRQVLERWSHRVTGFYPYRWIPYTAYDKFREEWQELVMRFDNVKWDILEAYDYNLDLLVEDFHQVAASAWQSIRSNHQVPNGAALIVTLDGVIYPDVDAFTDAIVQRALARMPSRERIEAELHADYTTALVYGEQDVAADMLAANRVTYQIEQERAKADAARQDAYLQQHLVETQYQHKETLLRLAEEEKRLKIQGMLQAEAEHARQQLQRAASPFEEIFTALRRQMADDCQAMLESIQKNGYVRGKIAEKGRGLLELYQLMAAHDDFELRDRLITLKAAIGPTGDDRPDDTPERNTAEIVNILDQIKALSHSAAQDLAAGPSRFSFVEI